MIIKCIKCKEKLSAGGLFCQVHEAEDSRIMKKWTGSYMNHFDETMTTVERQTLMDSLRPTEFGGPKKWEYNEKNTE